MRGCISGVFLCHCQAHHGNLSYVTGHSFNLPRGILRSGDRFFKGPILHRIFSYVPDVIPFLVQAEPQRECRKLP